MLRFRWIIQIALLAGLLLSACDGDKPTPTQPPGMANPASTNCIEKGGALQIVRRGDGGEYGVCIFEENRQCEEWALLRGDCPEGGIKITGYVTPSAIYCAISGGQYEATTNIGALTEQGNCTFKNGKVCDSGDYYYGRCNPDQ